MKQSVLIKGNKVGLTLYLDPSVSFEELYNLTIEKFQASSAFFQFSKPIAIRFEGKILDSNEINQMLSGIAEVTSLQIGYVMIEDTLLETKMQQMLEEKKRAAEEARIEKARLMAIEAKNAELMAQQDGLFHKGTLRSGQSIESDNSVIILGDVNPGATVSSKKNVVVFGALKGYAYAGTDGDDKAFIIAMEMLPMQIRIGSKIARKSDEEEEKKRSILKKRKKSEPVKEPQMAFVEDGQIYIEPISKSLIHDILV